MAALSDSRQALEHLGFASFSRGNSERRKRMTQLTNKADVITRGRSDVRFAATRDPINSLINVLIKFGILKTDLDYHLIRASMVIIFCFLGIKNGLSTRRRY
jgi:hypothetical protein